ncbi:MAG TPA: sialidase family protein, partial [Candidatus Saccharimonadia bacterium]|nr:sialidase family protein [Candidatus Saccharimonadia bacterium]
SLLRHDDHRLLFSNPYPKTDPLALTQHLRRERLTVRTSTDDGKSWPVSRVLHEGPSAYSSLARLPDGTILCLYEGGEKNSSEALRLARFNLDWLTESK